MDHPRAGPTGDDVAAGLRRDLESTVRATRQLFGAAACSCALATASGDELRFVAADGAGAEAIVGVAIPVSRGIAGWAAMTGEPIAVADVEKDARFARDVAESTEYVPSTILAVPVMSEEGEVSGVIEVLDPSRPEEGSGVGSQRGTAAELATLTLVATQLATVIRVSRALDALQAGVASGTGAAGEDGTALADSLRSVSATGPGGVRLAQQVMSAVAEYTRSRG